MAKERDEILAAKAAGGDRRSFEDLVNRHRESVYRLARSITGTHDDADDAAQETFIRLYRSLSSYDPERPFVPWLRRVAYNTSLNVLRASKRRWKETSDELLPTVADTSHGPEDVLQTREAGRLLREAVEDLSSELRATFMLRASEGMSYRDIASVTGVRMGTVMSRLSRAREKILQSIEPIIIGGDW